MQLFIKEAAIGRLGYSAVPGAGKAWAQQELRSQSECNNGNFEHGEGRQICQYKHGEGTGQSTMLKHASTVMTQTKADVQHTNKAKPQAKVQYSDAAQAQ